MMLRNRKSKQSFSSSSAKSNKEGHNVPEDGDSATKSVQSENSLSLTDAYDKMKVKDRAQNVKTILQKEKQIHFSLMIKV